MKNQIIATIVAALILFIWQFLSWSMLNVHGSEMQYMPNQDAALEALGEHMQEGTYFLPNLGPGASEADYEAYKEKYIGKPWAVVSYHSAMKDTMGMNMFRGFVVDLLAAFLLVWLLMKFENLTMATSVMASLAVGVIGYLTIPYLNAIWFESPSLGYLVDAVVQWGLVGIWLGWFLTRK